MLIGKLSSPIRLDATAFEKGMRQCLLRLQLLAPVVAARSTVSAIGATEESSRAGESMTNAGAAAQSEAMTQHGSDSGRAT